MELRGPEQDDLRSTIPSNYGLVERRRDHGGSNTHINAHNGIKTPPTAGSSTGLAYNPAVDQNHHRGAGSTVKRPHERYRECLRNHAASVGGNVYDGCGEFMPAGEEGTLEALKCAACDCHRNFHRKEIDGDYLTTPQYGSRRRSVNSTPNSANATPSMVHGLQLPAISYHPHPHHYHHQRFPPVVQPMSVAFGGGSGGGNESSSEEMNVYHSNNMDQLGGVAPPPPSYVLSKKRFRTKFTVEQKEKMMEFAEKIGWRINRQEEGEVERFCEEIGIRRQVFKVWMHNNKNLKKVDAPVDEQELDNQQQPAL